MQATTVDGLSEGHHLTPCVPGLVAAVCGYCAAAGTHYYCNMGSKHHDAFLVCGAIIGLAVGFMCGLDPRAVVFQVLPGMILVALLVHRCAF